MDMEKMYPNCHLGSIISPGEYWLVSKLKRHVGEVKILEELLSLEMNTSLQNNDSFDKQSSVAVASQAIKGLWHRGKILQQINENTYEVFLIDSGVTINVEPQQIQILKDPKYTQVEPLAFKFYLYGIVPVVTCDKTFKKQVKDNWRDEAIQYVQSLFSKELNIYVKKIHMLERNIFGDLYMTGVDGETLSLRKLLCEKAYAVYSEAYYQRKVLKGILKRLSESEGAGVDSEFSEKMLRVEEWQKTSFEKNVHFLEDDDRFEGFEADVPDAESTPKLESARAWTPEAKNRKTVKDGNEFGLDGTPASSKRKSGTLESSGATLENEDAQTKGGTIQKNKGNPKKGGTIGQNGDSPKKSEIILKSEGNSSKDTSPIKSEGDSKKDKTVHKSQGDSKKDKAALKKEDNSKEGKTIPTNEGSSKKDGNTLKNEEAGSKKDGAILKSEGNSKKDKTVPKSQGDSKKDKTVPKNQGDSKKDKTVPKNQGDSKKDEGKCKKEKSLKNEEDPQKDKKGPKTEGKPALKKEAACKGDRTFTKGDGNGKKSGNNPRNEGRCKKGGNFSTIDGSPTRDSNFYSRDDRSCSSKEENFDDPFAPTQSEEVAQSRKWRREKHSYKTQLPHQMLQPLNKKSNCDIFTFCQDVAIIPVDTFRNSSVSENIIMNLELHGDFKGLSSIQKWAIPALQRGCNVGMISSARTGKTLAYIVSILDLLQNKLNLEEETEGNGPYVVVICASARSCEFVYNTCKLLLPQTVGKQADSKVKISIAHGGGQEKNVWVDLTNGCDLLISTPHCLVRLLKFKQITNLERLKVLVLDDVHIITREPFLSEVKILLHQAKHSSKHDYQKVFSGELWSPELASVYGLFTRNHVLLFGSHLEAAIFAKPKPFVYFATTEAKTQVFLDIISDKINRHKMLIVCCEKSEVLKLKDVLEEMGHSPLAAHEMVLRQDIKSVRDSWTNDKRNPILICTDEVIPELQIDDAEILVHYSLPYRSKTNFGNRFATLAGRYKSSTEEKDRSSTSTIIIIDDQNHMELPHIVDFVVRLGGKVSENILTVCENIKWKVEMSKEMTPICKSVLEFGECRNAINCRKRHALSKEVDSGTRFLSGLIKFEVICVHDVCHLSVRITEYLDGENRKFDLEDLNGEISEELQKFYADEENKKFVSNPEATEMFAMEFEEHEKKHFCRVVVVECRKMNRMKEFSEVVVKLIDKGYYAKASISDLYELPKELKEYPPQSMDVFLCSLLPKDFDSKWSTPAIILAERIFMNKPKENQFWIGKIVLSLSRSLHIHPVKLCHKLETLNTHSIDMCAHKKFISYKTAMKNMDHLPRLKALCEKAGIEMPDYESMPRMDGDEPVVQPDRAFFQEDFMRVHFVTLRHTTHIYVRMSKFSDLLERLEKECSEEAKRKQKLGDEVAEWKKGLTRLKSFPSSIYCLASYDGCWLRGRIDGVESDDKGYVVFFIDYGDYQTVKEVLPITPKLLLQLPAQALECSLVGVKHKEVCPVEVLDYILDFTANGDEVMYAKVFDRQGSGECTGGRKFEVNLVNREGISLNKKLITEGLIELDDEKKDLLEDIEIPLWGGSGTNDSDDSYDGGEIDEDWMGEDPNLKGKEFTLNEHGPQGRLLEASLDDENAKLFMDEFVEKFFPDAKKKVEEVSNKKTSVLSPQKEEPSRIEELPFPPPKDISSSESAKYVKASKGTTLTSTKVVCHTPQVVWSQDHSTVVVKIMLTNVMTYKFDCSATHILFRCMLDNKLYTVSLKIFGGINPSLTVVQVKTFFVQIALVKLSPLIWPRFQSDKQKYRWINLDVESHTEREISYCEEVCSNAMNRIKKGEIRQGKAYREVDFVPWTDSDDDISSDDDFAMKDDFLF